MKFGIIGTGMISQFHALAIEAMEHGSLHSCYNHHPEKGSEEEKLIQVLANPKEWV